MDYNFKYSEILPPLTKDEYQALKADIEQRGILVPVIIDEDKNVIDGQHRLIIADELKLKDIPFELRVDLNDEEKQQLAIDLNLHRRQLNKEQLQELAIDLRNKKRYSYPLIADTLGIDQKTAWNWIHDSDVLENSNGAKPCKVVGRDNKEYSSKRKPIYTTSTTDITRAKKIIKKSEASKDFKYLKDELIQTGNIKRGNKEINRLDKLEKRQESITDVPDNDNVWHGDFREVGQKIPDNSVDLIFTDPPYNEDAIRLYQDLGIFAKRVLKPGGLCLSYSGLIFLPTILAKLTCNLEYLWIFAIKHQSNYGTVFAANILQAWKPIIAFCKPPKEMWWQPFPDIVVGKKEKDSHEWQQSIVEAMYYIERLCPPKGGIVVDPFCGGGTTLVAAKLLKLSYIGIDIDQNSVEQTAKRLNDTSAE